MTKKRPKHDMKEINEARELMSPEELAFFDASVRDLAANKITPFQWEDRVYTYFGLSKEECLQ